MQPLSSKIKAIFTSLRAFVWVRI